MNSKLEHNDNHKVGSIDQDFWEEKQNDVELNRKLFFEMLRTKGVSPIIIHEVKDFLTQRTKDGEGKLVGEYYPWIIKELANIENEKFDKVTINWLPVYTSICMIDDEMDKNQINSSVENTVSEKVISTLGILNLYKIVNGTKYEELFLSSIIKSANGQLTDASTQGIKDVESKEYSAKEKNKLLIALAGAMAASVEPNSEKSKFIIDFSSNILTALQYLDDISDFSIDYNSQNYTYLLSLMNENTSLTSDRDIISELLKSGALSRTLDKTINSLENSIELIQNVSFTNLDNKAAILFVTLNQRLNSFHAFISKYSNENFDKLDIDHQQDVLNKVEKYIKDIALAS